MTEVTFFNKKVSSVLPLSVQCLAGCNNNLLLLKKFYRFSFIRTDETKSSNQVLHRRRDQKLWQRWMRRDVVQVNWLRPSLLCLMKESACAFENPVHLYQTRGRHTPQDSTSMPEGGLSFILPRGTITYRTYATADHFKNLHQTQDSKVFKIIQLARERTGLFSALLWTAPPNLCS
jgi:hypothetical protein